MVIRGFMVILDEEIIGEIKLGLVTTEMMSGTIIRKCCIECGVKCAQPQTPRIAWESNLRHPFSPLPLAHTFVQLYVSWLMIVVVVVVNMY